MAFPFPSRLVSLSTPLAFSRRDPLDSSETETGSATDHGRPKSAGRYVVQVLLVVLAYFIAGKLGQATSSIRSSNLGPVWPAYGVALSAILLYGYRVWIGVAIGAFLVAFGSPAPHLAAVGQASGATLGALTGTFLLSRVAKFHLSISRLRDAVALIIVGAFGSAIVSASIGISSLLATGVKAYLGTASAWLIYWLGDSTGVLLVTPLILTLPSLARIRSRRSMGEFAALLLSLIATCLVLFGEFSWIQIKFHVLAFGVLPFVMWAAIKFEAGGASLSILVTATIATVATAYGRGPFAASTPFANAILLDVFFSVLAVSGLTLAAATAERDQTAWRLTEDKLREYRNAVEGTEEMIVVVDREYRYVIANRRFLERRKLKKEQVVGHLISDVSGKEVFETIMKEKLDRCFGGEVVRYEMKFSYPDLGERDVFVSYFPVESTAGVDRVACIVQDITERRQAEEAIRSMNRRLIEAQEQEAARIARELHDDINQRLALLAAKLDVLQQDLPASTAEIRSAIAEVSKEIESLGIDIQALSHRMHSSKLDILGLSSSAASLCREFSARQGVEILFQSENIRRDLPREISVCLFRALQEALQNAIKHSGTRRFEVSLHGESTHIELVVRDSGTGFDPKTAMTGTGLGLMSIGERLKLVDGELVIDSQPHRGTEIKARVPITQKVKSAGAC